MPVVQQSRAAYPGSIWCTRHQTCSIKIVPQKWPITYRLFLHRRKNRRKWNLNTSSRAVRLTRQRLKMKRLSHHTNKQLNWSKEVRLFNRGTKPSFAGRNCAIVGATTCTSKIWSTHSWVKNNKTWKSHPTGRASCKPSSTQHPPTVSSSQLRRVASQSSP